MGTLSIREVKTAGDRYRFIKMPWKIYRDDPHWVPPIIADQKKFIDPRKGVFFEHGEAALFTAWRDGKSVGRISAHINTLYDGRFPDGKGFFGFFECENNEETASALFARAEEYLRSKGRKISEGSLSFGIYDEVGILVDGFDSDPFLLNVHNPPYYGELIEKAGYEKSVDWIAFRGDIADYPNLNPRLIQAKERSLSQADLTLRPVNLKELKREVAIVKHIFNTAWDKNWGHVPLTDSEFDRLVGELARIAIPELSFIAEKDGNPVAFCLSLYDANVAVKKINGRLYPFGFITLLLNLKKTDRFRQMLMGVLEEYRGRGIEVALFMSIAEAAYRHGFKTVEMSLIVETNDPMLNTIKYLPVQPYKTYRIFRKAL